MSGLFTGAGGKEREAAFLFNVHFGGNSPPLDWRGIRTKDWSYSYNKAGDWVMYDLKKDPYQFKNLVDDPGSVGKKKELRAQLDAMRRSLGESRPLGGNEGGGKKGRDKKKQGKGRRRKA